LQWALVALDGVVDQKMPFEFVLAVERAAADVTLERLVVAVDHHVHLEILLGLEALHAYAAHVVCCQTPVPL